MFDVIILGAGAAGLFCAACASARGRRVLLLDHAAEAGQKILISGGGRCNFTNRTVSAAQFLSLNPSFCISALARYTPADFVALVERHRIAYHEKTLGQLFCDGSARQILAMLLAECDSGGVDLRLSQQITAIERGDHFRVVTAAGTHIAPCLVLATGGLSIPKLGATGLAYDTAMRFGLRLVPPAPALVPLTFGGDDLALMRPLSGVSLPVEARTRTTGFCESLLFTHRGLSGPAILQVSSYWRPGTTISVNLLPGQSAGALLLEAKRLRPRSGLRTILAEQIPTRLAAALAPAMAERPMADWPDRQLAELAERLANWSLTPSGTEGFAKAEVTGGGIDTSALSSRSLQANAVPGLFVIGEAVDVTGWLGGYNFQWAWSSGFAAAEAV